MIGARRKLSSITSRYPNKTLLTKKKWTTIYKHYNFIIKSINKNKYNYNNEFKIVSQLHSPYVIKPLDYYTENNTINIIYPYYPNEDLYNFINRKYNVLTEIQILKLLKKLYNLLFTYTLIILYI